MSLATISKLGTESIILIFINESKQKFIRLPAPKEAGLRSPAVQ
jgi:hypothetical protein